MTGELDAARLASFYGAFTRAACPSDSKSGNCYDNELQTVRISPYLAYKARPSGKNPANYRKSRFNPGYPIIEIIRLILPAIPNRLRLKSLLLTI